MATIPLQIAERRLDPGNVVQYPQGGETGRALQEVGSDFTAVADRIQQRQDEMDRFKRITIENAMDADTANQAAEAARNGSADGAGLHDTIVGQVDPATGKVAKPGLFDTIADRYRAQIPQSQRGYFDASLPAKRLQLSGSAASAQFEQEQKYATLETTKIQNGLISTILQMDPNDSASYDAYKAKGRQAILASPLAPLAKQSTLEGWDQAAPKALAQAITARDPGQLRRLFGMAPPAGASASTGIVATDIPPEGAALLNAIAGPESGGKYNVINGGETFSSFAAHPKAGQHGDSGIAAGRYQFLPSTWDRASKALGLTDFSEANQDRAAWWLAKQDYKANTGRDLQADLKSPDAQVKANIRQALSSTWTGLKNVGDGNFARSLDDVGARSIPDAPNPEAVTFLESRLVGHSADHVTNMQPALQNRLAAFIQSAPPGIRDKLGIFSGARSDGRQAELYAAALKKYGSEEEARKWVAPPGKSNHNKGQAADLSYGGQSLAKAPAAVVSWVHDNAGAFGLKFPLANENWHIEVDETRGGRPPANATMDKRFAGMSPDDMLQLANQDDVAFRQKQAADVAQAKVEYQAYKDHIELGIRTGEIRDPAQILNSKLNEGDQATLYEMQKNENKDNAGVDAIISALGANQKVPINTFDSDQTKIGDKAFGQYVAKVAPENQPAATATYVAATGYIPDQVQAQLRQGAASTTAPALAASLSQADTLQKIAPASFGAIPGSDVQTKLTDFRHMVNDLGMPGEAAAAEILRRADPAVKVNREVLKPKADEFAKKLTVGDVTNAFDPGMFSSEPGAGLMPEQSSALLAEYREIATEKFYDTNGDVGLAKARAVEDLKKRWNVTNITGSPTLMRMPPELHYPPIGGNYDYLRQDAMATAQAYANEHGGQKVENVTIWPSDKTRADIEQGRPPRYRLFYQYSDHGQPTFTEVFAGPWGVGADAMRQYSDDAGKKSVHLSDVSDRANDIELSAEKKARAINADPGTEDFIKALNSEATVGAGRVQADMYRQQNAEPVAPAPLTPEDQRARDRGTSTYDGSQKTGFGNN
ncbi:D-alanyl-D-alanine carboxypeptidase family protein [Mesorhizobium sp. B2-3-4]|uniref:D-alanyl-D-alanine carboxypeptidase family protein n=1 Tax=Mesorhizobium sp. B2-3-4 TaxID=2589959 RepID=UPI00112854F4|nr:D-alanyl-D-alanine carboxypeptidase family protein [Mesorhizobium sp. B2-3-4]TPM25714.1 hypothetical protein FJ967_32330 [Mesorhizobium sp. B2-3-4]